MKRRYPNPRAQHERMIDEPPPCTEVAANLRLFLAEQTYKWVCTYSTSTIDVLQAIEGLRHIWVEQLIKNGGLRSYEQDV